MLEDYVVKSVFSNWIDYSASFNFSRQIAKSYLIRKTQKREKCRAEMCVHNIRKPIWLKTTMRVIWSVQNVDWLLVIVSLMSVLNGVHFLMTKEERTDLVLVDLKTHFWVAVICRRWLDPEKVRLPLTILEMLSTPTDVRLVALTEPWSMPFAQFPECVIG